jgi:hypothetical protein
MKQCKPLVSVVNSIGLDVDVEIPKTVSRRGNKLFSNDNLANSDLDEGFQYSGTIDGILL